MPDQLSIDGTEVPVVDIPRGPRLSPAQAEVMKVLRRNGSIRPVEAGLILYSVVDYDEGDRRAQYASSDGSELLRRLARRGLVHRESRGRWVLGPGPPVAPRRSEDLEAWRVAAETIRTFGQTVANVGVSFGLCAVRITALNTKAATDGR